MCHEEKENLKEYKRSFKQLIKSNGIRFASDVPFPSFNTRLEAYDSYKDLNTKTKVLLHEYYQYKIGLKEKEKEREKERKLQKAVIAFVLVETKLLVESGTLIINGLKSDALYAALEDKLNTSEFAKTAQELKSKACSQALKILLDESDSSSQSADEKRKSSHSRRH